MEIKNKFNYKYNLAKQQSNNYNDLTPIIALLKEMVDWGKECVPLMRIIEQDLLDRQLISSKVTNSEDYLKKPILRSIKLPFIFVRH